MPDEPHVIEFNCFTEHGKNKSSKRRFWYYADDSAHAKRLADELERKSTKLLHNDIERKVVELYSFGFKLDVGCGKHKMGDIGIDKKRRQNVDVVADAQFLPFNKRVFDCVIAHHVLEHIPDAGRAILEMRRVTKSSIIIAVPRYEASFVHPNHCHHWKMDELSHILSQVFYIERAYLIVSSYIFICQKWKGTKQKEIKVEAQVA